MKLSYKGFNRAGEAVSGEIEAASAHAATEALYADGTYVTAIQAVVSVAAVAGKMTRRAGWSGGGSRLKHVAGFTRQLSVLTSTGTSVVQALEAVTRQVENASFRAVSADVLKRVEEGETLADAMSHHPRCFDAVYRSLVAAGEASGQLPAMLTRLETMTRKHMKIKKAISGALAYPAMLLCLSVGVVITMLTGVVPRFAGLFTSLDAKIPSSTQMMLSLSESLRVYWWGYLLAVVCTAAGVFAFARSARGRVLVETLSVRAPVIGAFVRSLATARVIRTLGVLTEAKVPLLDAIVLTKEAAGLAVYRGLLDNAEQAVIHGRPISSALRENPLVPTSVYEAFVTGERSGQVGPILVSLSEYLDEDNEVVIKSMMSLIEPLILAVLGVVVGFVALSIFLPLFDLTAAAGAGGGS